MRSAAVLCLCLGAVIAATERIHWTLLESVYHNIYDLDASKPDETLSPEVLARGRSCMEEKLAGTDSSSLKVFNESLDVADKCFKILKGNTDKESFILCLESNLSETALKHAKESITLGQSLNVCLENALSEMKDTTPETAVH